MFFKQSKKTVTVNVLGNNVAFYVPTSGQVNKAFEAIKSLSKGDIDLEPIFGLLDSLTVKEVEQYPNLDDWKSLGTQELINATVEVLKGSITAGAIKSGEMNLGDNTSKDFLSSGSN
jgi:hypothetical protein